jgi:uncharacterized protein DUF5985
VGGTAGGPQHRFSGVSFFREPRLLRTGLFFLRFWRESRDLLFGYFAVAFFLLAIQRVPVANLEPTVVEKNRAH